MNFKLKTRSSGSPRGRIPSPCPFFVHPRDHFTLPESDIVLDEDDTHLLSPILEKREDAAINRPWPKRRNATVLVESELDSRAARTTI